MTTLYCATPSYFHAAQSRWGEACKAGLRYYWDDTGLNGMTSDEFRAVTEDSLEKVSKVSGLTIVAGDEFSKAHIEMRSEPMTGSTLAYAYFPTSCSTRVAVRFNSRVDWGPLLFLDTLSHELGHAFGMDHTNDRRDIMYPSIDLSRQLNGEYGQHYSIPEMIDRYGKPGPTTPPPPEPPTTPSPEPPKPPTPNPPNPTPWGEWWEIFIDLLNGCPDASQGTIVSRLRRLDVWDHFRLRRELRKRNPRLRPRDITRRIWELEIELRAMPHSQLIELIEFAREQTIGE